MDFQGEGGDDSPPDSPWSSSSSSSSGSGRSDASDATTATQSTLLETTGCQQTTLNSEFNQLAVYLAKEKAPERLRNALKRIRDAFTERIEKQTTTDAIQSLHEAVRKLTVQIEAKPPGTDAARSQGTSYAAAAQRGAAVAGAAQSRTQSHTEPLKPVPARHKREIIASKGEKTGVRGPSSWNQGRAGPRVSTGSTGHLQAEPKATRHCRNPTGSLGKEAPLGRSQNWPTTHQRGRTRASEHPHTKWPYLGLPTARLRAIHWRMPNHTVL